MHLKLIQENEKGKTYQAPDFKILYRYKGTVSGDNDINAEELIYFISGQAKVTIEEKTWAINSPAEIHIPARTYHKIKALTNISFIIFTK